MVDVNVLPEIDETQRTPLGVRWLFQTIDVCEDKTHKPVL